MPPTYTVTLVNERENLDASVQVSKDEYILNAGEERGLELPSLCRLGVCATCAGKLVEGSIDQPKQRSLNQDQLDQGYILTCIGRPTSDCKIITHKEGELY